MFEGNTNFPLLTKWVRANKSKKMIKHDKLSTCKEELKTC